MTRRSRLILDKFGSPRPASYYPDGMDPHNNIAQTAASAAAASALWKRMLDTGSVGQTIRFGSGAGEFPPAEARRLHRLIDIKGDDRHPEIVTVASVLNDTNGYQIRPDWFMKVRWGTENFQCEADVDLALGTHVSVLCAALQVDVASTAPDNSDPISAAVGVQVSYGQRAGHREPQRSLYVGPVPALGASFPTRMPFFSRDIVLYNTTPVATTYRLTFVGFDLATPIAQVFWNSSVAAGGNWYQKVPVPNDARGFVINNLEAFPVTYTAVIGLAL